LINESLPELITVVLRRRFNCDLFRFSWTVFNRNFLHCTAR